MGRSPEKPALQATSGLTPENFEELWETVMRKLRDPAHSAGLAGPFVDDDEKFDEWITNSLVAWAGRDFWPPDRPENTLTWADVGHRDEITEFWIRLIEYLGRVMRIVIGLESGAIVTGSEDPEAPPSTPPPVGISAASAFFKRDTPPSAYLRAAIDFVDSTTIQHMHVDNIRTLPNLRAALREDFGWKNVLGLWVEVGDGVYPVLMDDDGSTWMDALEMCGSTVVIWVEN